MSDFLATPVPFPETWLSSSDILKLLRSCSFVVHTSMLPLPLVAIFQNQRLVF